MLFLFPLIYIYDHLGDPSCHYATYHHLGDSQQQQVQNSDLPAPDTETSTPTATRKYHSRLQWGKLFAATIYSSASPFFHSQADHDRSATAHWMKLFHKCFMLTKLHLLKIQIRLRNNIFFKIYLVLVEHIKTAKAFWLKTVHGNGTYIQKITEAMSMHTKTHHFV